MSEPDPWLDLRAHTAARIALGRSGSSLPTSELLRFGLAHARACDAVQHPLDVPALATRFQDAGLPTRLLQSAAADRAAFLSRPDLGRRLSAGSRRTLRKDAAHDGVPGCDLLLVVADGLSAPAIERNAVPMVEAIRRLAPSGWRLGPLVLATQARVALGDEIGDLFGAGLVAMLIGERPGLSSPDSLGIYLTWQPRTGRTDAERNCISNIRPEGLDYDTAAHRFWWLCRHARQLRLTGVGLKDQSAPPPMRVAADDSQG